MSFFSPEWKFNMKGIVLLITLIMSFFSMLFINEALSASLPAKKSRLGKDAIQIIANSMSYNKETGVYKAYGNAEIHQVGRTLKANIIEYYYRTQTARAQGNVVLTEGDDILQCEYLEVNLETKEGLVRGGELFYQKGNFYLKGNYIQKLGENRYRIENGEFTTCNGKRPSWKFACKKADVTLEGLARVKGATFKIKDYPVFYFPYFVYPTRTKRQSGFLMPSVGSSSSEGVNFNNTFFWAISPNTDATAYLDMTTGKGIGLGGEYRYITSKTSRGRFYGYFISEKNSYRRDKYDQLLDREKKRWNVFYKGKKDFDQNLFARFKVDLVSDRQYFKDYESQTTRRTAERTENSAFLTKHWKGLSLVGDFEYNKDLLKSNATTVQRYPEIFFTAIPQVITHTPFFFSLDSTYNNFSRDEGQEGDRFDFKPRVILPLRFYKNFLLQSEAGYRQTLYFDTSDDEGLDNSRSLFNFRSELSTKFMKVYGGQGNPRRKFRHTIEPEIVYTYITDEKQEDLPLYDEVDRIQKQNRFAYAITNRVVGKYYRPDNSSWEREILFLRIGQYYDSSTSHDPFSNFFLELRSRPTSFWYIKSNLEFDIYDNEFEAFNTLFRFNDRRGDFLRFEYRFSKDRDEAISTHADIKLSRDFGVFFQNRQARQEGRNLETTFGIDYHPQCWGTILSCRIRPGTEGRDRETKFMVEFYLKGIGKVGGLEAGR